MSFPVVASFILIALHFVQQYLVLHCIGCPPIQTFSSFCFGISFLCCSVTMLCQHWVVWVVWNVLSTTCCSYMSSCLHFQGSVFQFQCMYAPPHPVKKCVVLCVRGLLCFVDPSLGPSSLMPRSGTFSCAPVCRSSSPCSLISFTLGSGPL